MRRTNEHGIAFFLFVFLLNKVSRLRFELLRIKQTKLTLSQLMEARVDVVNKESHFVRVGMVIKLNESV